MLMAVIECLLTHTASGRDDSIRRQVGKKVPLLLQRANRASVPFGASLEDCWKTLYEVRCVIAHGGLLQVGIGKLQAVASMSAATNYLDQSVRALLRHSLAEPDLVEQLADC
jgi:hypothetical protein